jgi:hypothetical protein
LGGDDVAQRYNSIGHIYGLRDGVGEMQGAHQLMNSANIAWYCLPNDVVQLHFEIADLMRQEAVADPSLIGRPPMLAFLKSMMGSIPATK